MHLPNTIWSFLYFLDENLGEDFPKRHRELIYFTYVNQNPYDYTVEVTNRCRGFYRIDECLKTYGWRLVILYRKQ